MTVVILLLAAALILVAWLTGAATAVRSVSRIWLRHWVERELAGTGTLPAYVARPHRLVLAAGAGSALLVALAGAVLGAQGDVAPGRLAIEFTLLAIALFVLGQLVPRAIARRYASALVPVLLPPLHAAAWVLGPFLRATRNAARALFPRSRVTGATSHEGIQDLLREGQMEGIGEPAEIEIITGVVEFGEKVLRDVMTPRTEMFAVDESMPAAEMARAVADSRYSRVPVYRGSLDEVVGMVHVFDLLANGAERWPPLREVAHAPATRRCTEALFDMLRAPRHLVIVLDEFGGTAGLVTLEDVLEELVGDIRDEHDEPAQPRQLPGARGVVVDASLPLQEGLRLLDPALAEGDHQDAGQTVGGTLVRALNRIPATGERFRLGAVDLTIVDAEPARVRRVMIQRADSAPPLELRSAR